MFLKNSRKFLFILLVFSISISSNANVTKKIDEKNIEISKIENLNDDVKLKKSVDSNGYEYNYADGYFADSREYKLKNGLTVYLTKNDSTPYIQSEIIVRAGSKDDPKESTGLAHYFEHLMFKGNDKIGTIDWSKEKPLLDKIEELYEKHRNESNLEKKKEIYKEIDKISYEASKYGIGNEFPRLVKSIGGDDMNAHTTYDNTNFTMSFPSKNLEKAILLERSRFDNVSLRGFHTELETVYEEFNLRQNSTFGTIFSDAVKELFFDHPYSDHAVIGNPYDLKNPSIKDIKKFYEKYYVANNIALAYSGNLDFDETIKLVDKYWNDYRSNEESDTSKNIPTADYHGIKEVDMTSPSEFGLYAAFKFPVKDSYLLQTSMQLLYNGLDGILDKMILEHRLQNVDRSVQLLKDGNIILIKVTPKSGDSLDDAKQALFEGIKRLKEGQFTDQQIDVLKDTIKKYRSNTKFNNEGITSEDSYMFINNSNFADEINDYNKSQKMTKSDIVNYLKNKFNDAYIVKKQDSKVSNLVFLEKPEITPIIINPKSESQFAKDFIKMPSLDKIYVDPNKENILKEKINENVNLSYIQNKQTNLFAISYIYPIGTLDNPDLAISEKLFYEIGTKNVSLEKLQDEMGKLDILISVSMYPTETEFKLTGDDNNKDKIIQAMKLFEEKVSNNSSLPRQYDVFSKNLYTNMSQAKSDFEFVTPAAESYALYGENSSFMSIEKNLKGLREKKGGYYSLILNEISKLPHEIVVYSPFDKKTMIDVLKETHNVNITEKKEKILDLKPDTQKGNVYLTNVESAVANVSLLSNYSKISDENYIFTLFYNEYENGLSGRTFKEIREKKGLTYNINNFIQNNEKNAYITIKTSTQYDKLDEMLLSLKDILTSGSKGLNEEIFETAKKTLINTYEHMQLKGMQLYYNEYTLNSTLQLTTMKTPEEILEKIKKYTFNDYKKEYDKTINYTNFAISITGLSDKIDNKMLSKYGKIVNLDPGYLLGENKNILKNFLQDK